MLALCRAAGIVAREKNFSLVDVYSAEEAFLTGTFGAQTPVGTVDGRVIGDGKLGPVTLRLRDLYTALVAA